MLLRGRIFLKNYSDTVTFFDKKNNCVFFDATLDSIRKLRVLLIRKKTINSQ